MSDLKVWEEKIKDKITDMNFQDYLKTVCSWVPALFYKNNRIITSFPKSDRIVNFVSFKEFENSINLSNKYGFDYDFNKNFFLNYEKLFKTIPLPAIRQFPPIENCDFSEGTGGGTKNCYLNIGVYSDCESIFYSFEVKEKCKNIYNSVMVWNNSEEVYWSNCILRSYKTFYSKFIYNSNNIWFSSNLDGCNECILCDNLVNASYCIKNKKYEKEVYLKMKNELLKQKSLFLNLYNQVSNKGNNTLSHNVKGVFITKSDNIKDGFFSYNIHNGKNVILSGSTNGNFNIYNTAVSGAPYANNLYNVLNSGSGNNMFNCDYNLGSNMYYCYLTYDCSFCLGCIGLKNKSFCILNKQYTKEEWYELANKIFAQMDNDGILGDFFPGSLNPFYFNDTMAYLIDDSFTKEEVEKEGYIWRDGEIKVDIPENAEVVYTSNYVISSEVERSVGEINNDLNKSNVICKEQIPPLQSEGQHSKKYLKDFQGYDSNGNWYINPDIMKKVIKDDKGNIYKIVPMEYDFLMKHSLPLPEIHWLDRIKLGFRFN